MLQPGSLAARLLPPRVHAARRALSKILLAALATTALTALAPARAFAQQADLVLNLSDSPDPVPAGGTINYAATVDNDASTTAVNVQFTLSVPNNARYGGYTGSGVTCSGMSADALGPGTITCTVPDIAFGATQAFTISLKTTTSGLVTAVGSVSSTTPDAQSSNNTVTATTTVSGGADVALHVTSPASASSGSTISYGLSVTNAGPDPATSLQVQFPIPAGFTVTSTLPGGCSSSSGTITCAISGTVASGGNINIGNITGLITAGSGSTVSGSASLGLAPGAPLLTPQDPNSTDNTIAFSTSITGGSDLKLTMSRSPGPPYFVGGAFSFTLTPTFSGDSPTGLTVVDVLPANYTIGAIAASQNGWSCSVSGQTVTCTRATAPSAGADVAIGTITIPVTVATTGTVTNSATISATAPQDPTMSNNTDTDGGTTLQLPTADLVLHKTTVSPALAVVGQGFTYDLSVTNSGPSLFFGTLTITDPIPGRAPRRRQSRVRQP